jgi:hypothetical protein
MLFSLMLAKNPAVAEIVEARNFSTYIVLLLARALVPAAMEDEEDNLGKL